MYTANQINEIRKLLTKFRQGGLSPHEAKVLTGLLQEGDENEALKAVLKDYWDEASDNLSHFSEVPSLQMLEQLKATIGQDVRQTVFQDPQKRFTAFRAVLKYAAVILITSALTVAGLEYVRWGRQIPLSATKEGVYEIAVSYGSKSRIVLPDGSVVNLNSGSTLRYPVQFSSVWREVFVDGEAFFDVKKDTSHPFLVKTRDLTIKVLGTRFNVKSYPEERTVSTTLISGKVEIYPAGEGTAAGNRLLVLKPRQQAVFEKAGNKGVSAGRSLKERVPGVRLTPLSVGQQTDFSPVISWKDNRLVFRDEPFAALAQKLERWYDVEIEIQDEVLAATLFSGTFEKETIEQALDALKIANPFDYKMNKNRIVITSRH